MYYHICSDGNHSFSLFNTRHDFVNAMNRIAICSIRFKVVILAFVLMDNHFHFAVRADSEEECILFIKEIKRLMGMHFNYVGEDNNPFKGIPVKVIPVTDEDYLRALICYIIKNPTKARKGMFYNYPWGSGSLYFSSENKNTHRKPMAVSGLTVDEVRRICETHQNIPKNWVLADGYLLPENYIAVAEVEALYKTSRSFMFHLSLNKDEAIETNYGEWNEIGMDDVELRAERDRIIVQRFGLRRVSKLSATERLSLAKELRHKYLCSRKQLSRMVHLPLEEIDRFI
ncbi:MAG: hypothetical protein J5699_08120 [Bacteroidales bacterium]|nr:hypothetical protein [Bacteroidales bacterium]